MGPKLGVIIAFNMNSPIDPILHAFQEALQAQDLAGATVRGYGLDVQFFRTWLEGVRGETVPWTHVKATDIQTFRQHLVGNLRQKAAAVNRRLQSLRRFFAWAVQAKHLDQSPAIEVKFLRTQPRMQPSALLEPEVHGLLRAAGQSPHGLAVRNYALVQLMLQTGLRVGEVVELKVSDLVIYSRSGWVCVMNGKGHRQREVPLNATARRALSAYFETRVDLKPADPVFLSLRGDPPTPRAIQQQLVSLARSARISRIRVTPHTLRHTFATSFLKDHPGKLVELASLLGHESLDTTAVYTKASRESLAEDVERSRFNVPG